MTSEHIIDFKRGDTFELGGQVLGADDLPIDIKNNRVIVYTEPSDLRKQLRRELAR